MVYFPVRHANEQKLLLAEDGNNGNYPLFPTWQDTSVSQTKTRCTSRELGILFHHSRKRERTSFRSETSKFSPSNRKPTSFASAKDYANLLYTVQSSIQQELSAGVKIINCVRAVSLIHLRILYLDEHQKYRNDHVQG